MMAAELFALAVVVFIRGIGGAGFLLHTDNLTDEGSQNRYNENTQSVRASEECAG